MKLKKFYWKFINIISVLNMCDERYEKLKQQNEELEKRVSLLEEMLEDKINNYMKKKLNILKKEVLKHCFPTTFSDGKLFYDFDSYIFENEYYDKFEPYLTEYGMKLLYDKTIKQTNVETKYYDYSYEPEYNYIKNLEY